MSSFEMLPRIVFIRTGSEDEYYTIMRSRFGGFYPHSIFGMELGDSQRSSWKTSYCEVEY